MNTQTSGLNPIQLHLLRMFNYTHSKQNLSDLKQLLAKYFAEKVDSEMDKLWETKELSQDRLKEIAKQHKRTPYKK